MFLEDFSGDAFVLADHRGVEFFKLKPARDLLLYVERLQVIRQVTQGVPVASAEGVAHHVKLFVGVFVEH